MHAPSFYFWLYLGRMCCSLTNILDNICAPCLPYFFLQAEKQQMWNLQPVLVKKVNGYPREHKKEMEVKTRKKNVVAQLGKWSIPLERILNYARNWDDGRTAPNAVCISCVASLMTCVPDLCMFVILAFGAACDLHYRQSAAATVGSWHVAGDTEDHKIWWAVTRATRVENQTINEAEYHLTFFFLTYHHLSAC